MSERIHITSWLYNVHSGIWNMRLLWYKYFVNNRDFLRLLGRGIGYLASVHAKNSPKSCQSLPALTGLDWICCFVTRIPSDPCSGQTTIWLFLIEDKSTHVWLLESMHIRPNIIDTWNRRRDLGIGQELTGEQTQFVFITGQWLTTPQRILAK